MINPSHPQEFKASRRKHGRATLQDVASQAGVTIMTVSRYLNAPEKVAPATAQKIKTAVQATGYTPNLQAGSLASGRSQVVAVIVPNMAHSIFADTLHGLGTGLQAAGLHMLVSSTSYSLSQEEAQLRTVLGWAPAGIVVTGRKHTPGALALLRAARDRGTPVVEIWDRSARAAEFVQIGFNHREAGQQMAKALLERHPQRELVYIDSGVAQDFRAHERAQGFVAACRAAKRHVRMILARDTEPVHAGGAAMHEWLSSKFENPVAFAFANDMLACGALFALQKTKLRVPQDIALLGFGDFSLGRHVSVSASKQGLSTLRINGEQIGHLCAQYLAAPDSTRNLATQVQPEQILRST